MAGTGDLNVLRLCRYLRMRVGSPFGFVSYGSHMAISMAIGLLFLGGGRYVNAQRALSRWNSYVCCLSALQSKLMLFGDLSVSLLFSHDYMQTGEICSLGFCFKDKCKKLKSLKQCLTATRPTSHN